MTKILGISGAKQSGKSTAMKFLHGYQLRLNNVVEKFLMDDNGDIFVNAITIDENGKEQDTVAFLDVERKDDEFVHWAIINIWPFVQTFSFADPLKMAAIQLFGLTEEQCYGTDEEKNTPINIKWEDVPTGGTSPSKGFMTAREFLQCFGTDICRKIRSDIWTTNCIRRIKDSGTDLAIIPDVRFPNEVEAIKKVGGKIIRFTRCPHEDQHASETALDEYEDFDCIINNAELNIDETNKALLDILREWEWLMTKG